MTYRASGLRLAPGLEAFVSVDEGREDVSNQLVHLELLIIGQSEDPLVVGQIDGELERPPPIERSELTASLCISRPAPSGKCTDRCTGADQAI